MQQLGNSHKTKYSGNVSAICWSANDIEFGIAKKKTKEQKNKPPPYAKQT
jgi:hypothetical protein